MRIFHGDRDLPAGAPSRLRTLFDFLAPAASGLHQEVFRYDDPRPALYELRRYVEELRPDGHVRRHLPASACAPGSGQRSFPSRTIDGASSRPAWTELT